MFISKNNCPVPFDQQPLNEYFALKDSSLFSWSISSNRSFIVGLIVFFSSLFILFSLFVFIVVGTQFFLNFLLLNLSCCNLVIFIVFIRLYLGWSYVVKRLLSATIFYEESGWYDGQIWIKTSNYLMQDRLVGKYQVMPFITRIKYTLIVLCLNFFIIYLLSLIY